MARKRFSNEFKARVALEAIKGDKTVAQLSSQYEVHASQINNRKKQTQERMVDSFEQSGDRTTANAIEVHEDRLYRYIGDLQVEVSWTNR